MQGWVKLHRSRLDWEWYGDPNIRGVFTHCLLKSNFEPKKWHGISVPAGSFITSIGNLAGEIGISTQNVRTALAKLKSTNNLTIKTTNKYTVISIINWDDYQSANEQTNKQSTNNQQTTNNSVRIKEYKNDTLVVKTTKGEPNTQIQFIVDTFESLLGFKPTDKKPRFEAHNLMIQIKATYKELGKDPTEESLEKHIRAYFLWLKRQDWFDQCQTMSVIRRKYQVFKGTVCKPSQS